MDPVPLGPPWAPHSLGGKLPAILTLLPLPELEPRGQQPIAKAEGSPTAILIGCLVAIILLLLLIIALMLWRLHWRRLLSKVGGCGGQVRKPHGSIRDPKQHLIRITGGGLNKETTYKSVGGAHGH